MANLQGFSMYSLQAVTNGFRSPRGFRALHEGLSLELDKGDLVLLAGRNGAGKSTLMRIMAGLESPVAGKVFIQGEDLHSMGTERRAGVVSMMLPHPPDLHLTTCAEVVFSSRQRFTSPWKWDMRKHRGPVLEALERCGMADFAERDFGRLSDGEKQRVMLARSLAQETPVLLLDEPLAFLDYPGRREMLDLLNRICREEGKIMVYSSHDLELSLQRCRSLLLLGDAGSWSFSTDTAAIRETDPATLFVT